MHSVQVNTKTATDDTQSTCSAGMPGGDVAIGFTLAEPAGFEVQFQQTQSARSIFALYQMPAPGLACDANQLSCAFEDESANAVAFVQLPAGRYIFIVKAQSPSQSGSIRLRLSAFGGPKIEICGNGIDDDGNGLIDCNDPACFGIASFPARTSAKRTLSTLSPFTPLARSARPRAMNGSIAW